MKHKLNSAALAVSVIHPLATDQMILFCFTEMFLAYKIGTNEADS